MKKKAFAALCAATVMAGAVSAAAPVTAEAAPAPLVSYDFEDGFGDMTPGAKGETAAPSIVTNDIKGGAAQVEFGANGAESYATFPNPFVGKELSAATISAWVNIPDTASFFEWDCLIGFSNGDVVNDSAAPGARLTLEARPYLCWNAGADDNWIDLKSPTLAYDGNLGKWQHYAVVLTPEGQTLYVNGETVTAPESASGAGLDNASILSFLSAENTSAYLGLGSFWGSQGALMDDISFYDTALTAEEIKETAGIDTVLAAQPEIGVPTPAPTPTPVEIVRVDLSTVTAAVPEGYSAYYKFEGNMKDEVSGLEGITVGLKYNAKEFVPTSYNTGVKGQAMVFDGLGGAKLPVGPKSKQYTISANWYINKATQYSPVIFLGNLYENGILRGEDSDAQWISIAPLGHKEVLSDGPMVWSRNVPGEAAWNDCVQPDNKSLEEGKWYNVTVVADGASATIYVDGTAIVTGPVADIVDETTAIYLGVNAWDAPFNGMVDNLYIYDRCLNADEVASLAKESLVVEEGSAPTEEPTATPTPEPTKEPAETTPVVTPASSGDTKEDSSNTGLVVGIVVVVILVAAAGAVVVMKKKQSK